MLFPIIVTSWLLFKSSGVDKTVILLPAQALDQVHKTYTKSLVKFRRNSKDNSPHLFA